jgi:hypothetical protein
MRSYQFGLNSEYEKKAQLEEVQAEILPMIPFIVQHLTGGINPNYLSVSIIRV